mgnify:CR=1 FL=1
MIRVAKEDIELICQNLFRHISFHRSMDKNDIFHIVYKTLHSKGYSDTAIARFCNVSDMTIVRYKKKRDEEPIMHYQV